MAIKVAYKRGPYHFNHNSMRCLIYCTVMSSVPQDSDSMDEVLSWLVYLGSKVNSLLGSTLEYPLGS
jgi:hypothetical protein